MAPFAQTRVMAHLKPGRGRPSDYRSEYCDAVITYMSLGFSLTAFAGSIRVSRDAVYDWINRHSEFSDAVSRARSARVAALEAKLLRSRKGAETTASIFALRNADPVEWRDVRTVQHDHTVKAESLTDAELLAIIGGPQEQAGQTIDGECSHIDTGKRP